jgi:hypothetical protein
VFAGAVVSDGVNPDEFLADADLDCPDLDLAASELVADPVAGPGE